MRTLKFETFEEVKNDAAVREYLEADGNIMIEVVGIQFMLEDIGAAVKVYKYGKDCWLYAGKYQVNR
jgi:hypothetical protein